ncbi:M20 family metallo-hydrolase [Pseudanabaena sp. FACHB-2040]|uniref:M20 family metallo-hydrolase n=1 Tax=Pseudanabaena sp. FACHB-2040 TaxID=2692859 RepID=UPI00168776D7|nr:M20 family metallo-hydrolase [Pseudanabaena sp. FACHB-2040]MBD2259364.1 M20 family metallo-hydrolase [Pseudanabaena sp. FACHB-2040]
MATATALQVNCDRMLHRLDQLAQIGSIPGGGVCRLALTDEDKAGRDQVVAWMKALGLTITVDQLGNVVGTRPGLEAGPPVMTGSHIDTVATGGRYDGNLGVLAGLEVIETLNERQIQTRYPLAVAFFTNEEGARFHPDMMGSWVFSGGFPVEAALAEVGTDGTTVAKELERIGYAGTVPCGSQPVKAFVELHVEQGPVLDQERIQIGAVTGVQGMIWQEFTVKGVSNHAGTTPMHLRHDAGYGASAIAVAARQLALEMGGNQVATVGSIQTKPGLVNVIAKEARLTVDLRNTDSALLHQAEAQLNNKIQEIATAEGLEITSRSLARFEPVAFDPAMIDLVAQTAAGLGLSVKHMPSGAGHDAGMIAAIAPTAMIFVPSVDGISHNVKEYTAPQDLENGANILLQVLLKLAL